MLKLSNKIYLPTTGFSSPPHSTGSPQMCFVSRARYRSALTLARVPHLGEWYWDAIPQVIRRNHADAVGPGPDEIAAQQHIGTDTGPTFEVALRAEESPPGRAPPRDRTLSTGTSAPNRASRPVCVL